MNYNIFKFLPLLLLSDYSYAGSFALREQSSAGQGLSFAGAAAGSSGLSSMFWNPATITDYSGVQVSTSGSFILPYIRLNNQNGSGSSYSALENYYKASSSSGNEALSAVIPSGYISWQINNYLWSGISVTVPYGMSTKPDSNWSGRTYNNATGISSINISPNIAYKLNDKISIAGGLNILHISANYTSAYPSNSNPTTWPSLGMKGSGTALGFNLGTTAKLTTTTTLGIGYKSPMLVKINGDFFGYPVAPYSSVFNTKVKTTIPLPQSINIGIRQKVTDKIDILGELDWTNWSVLKSPSVYYASNGLSHPILPSIPFYYKDGWYSSLGMEYYWDSKITLRTGIGYEWSPITNTDISVRLPETDKIWTSIGFKYTISDQLNLDFGYSHIFPKTTTISIDSNNHNKNTNLSVGLQNLVTSVNSHADIISMGLTYKFN